MIIIMEEKATTRQVQKVYEKLLDRGFDIHRSTDMNQIVLGVVGNTQAIRLS